MRTAHRGILTAQVVTLMILSMVTGFNVGRIWERESLRAEMAAQGAVGTPWNPIGLGITNYVQIQQR